MHEPDQRHSKRESISRSLEAVSQRRQSQRVEYQPIEREAGDKMNNDVEDVVAGDVQTAPGVIGRQADRQQRSRGGGTRHRRDWPELPNGRVIDDVLAVVEKENTLATIGVHEHPDGDNDQHSKRMWQEPT
jgi:hypothetical protein